MIWLLKKVNHTNKNTAYDKDDLIVKKGKS